jgi:predicted nucleic acid-binding protein
VDLTCIVVDTNILFASLLHSKSRFRHSILTDTAHVFYCPRFVVVELFKHKERIAQVTDLNENELLDCLNALLARVTFVEEGVIPIGTWMEGRRLCSDVDIKDSPFVTLTLHVDGLLWKADEELKAGLGAKGFGRFFTP